MQKEEISKEMKLQHPFTCIVSGPSGCGKSSLVKKIITDNVIDPAPNEIFWLYAEDQPLYKTGLSNVKFIQGLPDDLETMFDPTRRNVAVIDDLMTEAHSDQRMTKLFSVGSHHRNLSIIFIIHNLFHYGREMRTLSLNSHYLILFKNPRDHLQIATLARQMYPGRSQFLIEAFEDATKVPHGYLIIDLKPETEDQLRIRTGILPSDRVVVYVQKESVQ